MKSLHFDHVKLKPDEQIGLHEQPTWELDYIIRGHGQRTLGGTTEPFSEGEVVLLRPEVPHVWQFEPSGDDIENISLTFTDHFLQVTADAFPEMQSTISDIFHLPDAIPLSGTLRERTAQMLLRMEQQQEVDALLTLLQILTMISQATDRKAIETTPSESANDKRLKAIDIYIRCNYAHGIILADIAKHVGMNTSSLCSFYKHHTGQTLMGRLTCVRIERAKYMLTHTRDRISSVCYAVGYNDQPHFCRVFRREVGCSPKEYRSSYNMFPPSEDVSKNM